MSLIHKIRTAQSSITICIMNWQANPLWILLIISCACTKQGVLDEKFVQGLSAEVRSQTFNLSLQTIRYPDSVYTGATPFLLVGKSTHSTLGEIESIARATVLQEDQFDIIHTQQAVTYDSVRISLHILYVQGTKKSSFSLKMHPLKEPFVVDRQYFSTSVIPYYEDSLVLDKSFSYEVDEKEQIDTMIHLRGEDLWGKNFLKQALHPEKGILFLVNYPGFVFSSPSSAGIIGIDPEKSSFSIYYTVPGEEEEPISKEKVFLFQRRHYNQYLIDLSGSAFASLERGEGTTLGEYAYAHGATGVFCSVDLTPLKDFYQSHSHLHVVAARLKSKPAHSLSTDSELFLAPQSLRLSLPFADPKSPDNVVQNIIEREVVNDRLYVDGEPFFNKVDDQTFSYQGSIVLGLNYVFSEEYTTNTWLLSAADYRGIEPIVLPVDGLLIDVFYTLNN